MSQDNQHRKPEEELPREGRSGQPEMEPVQDEPRSPGVTPAGDGDDMDDEDRDDDLRDDGSPNRRSNIG